MDSTLLFSLGLLIVSAIMAYYHHIAWQTKREAVGQSQIEFIDRQYRRRIQVSAMLGIVAIAMFAGRWVEPLSEDRPWFYMAYWMVIVIVVFWIALLAMADYIATRHFLEKSHQDQIIEEARLRAELQKALDDENESPDDTGSG